MTASYPLSWPPMRPRKASAWRKVGHFGIKKSSSPGSSFAWKRELSVSEATKRVLESLDRVAAQSIVISTNIKTRNDGMPRSGEREPDDPGVAIYFHMDGKPICMPCDTYTRVADNVAAVAAHIEATRAIERHGVASLSEMFSGFAALTAPGASNWWDVLQCRPDASAAVVEANFRRLAKDRHPDKGGSEGMMAELNTARDRALKEIGA